MTGILYLLAILSKIITAATVIAVVAGIATIVFLIVKAACTSLCANQEERSSYHSEYKFNLSWVETSKKVLKNSIPALIVSVLVLMFVPTTKEAYIIYGVGETVEYLKNNDTAKQLPDKAINALDSWLEAITIEPNEVETINQHNEE